jgi:uncharacterized protein (DUF2267 family)
MIANATRQVFNLAEISSTAKNLKATGTHIAQDMQAAADIQNSVLETLRRYRSVDTPDGTAAALPLKTRVELASMLGEASDRYVAASTALDDAFDAGTWMSKVISENGKAASHVQETLLHPGLGPRSADYARALLAERGLPYAEAMAALRDGDAIRLADPRRAARIPLADERAFAEAAEDTGLRG